MAGNHTTALFASFAVFGAAMIAARSVPSSSAVDTSDAIYEIVIRTANTIVLARKGGAMAT
jgi:hypothetical protein